MLISVTAARPDTPRRWPPSCVRGLSARSGSFVSPSGWKFFQGPFFFNFFFLSWSPSPPPFSSCRLPGFRCVKACIIFHQLSVLISTKAAAMEQPLRLFAGVNFTDVRPLSFPLAWTRRSGDGFARQTRLVCVCARESKWHKKAGLSEPRGMEKVSIMRTSNQSKTKARMKWRKCPVYGERIVNFFCPVNKQGWLQIQVIVGENSSRVHVQRIRKSLAA